ncbi:MAG TPA: FtsX-like permease family protein [Actinocrinis sp.]|jgi:putative ABC transport system permease protein
MSGWMLAGLRRRPAPMIGTLVAATTAAMLSIAAFSVVAEHSQAPLGRLATADVVVAADNQLTYTTGQGDNADTESVPLPAYRGLPATLAQQLAGVSGVASAVGETGFPDGTVPPGTVDLIAVKADPGISPDTLAQRIRTDLHGGAGYTIATGAARGDLADPQFAVERANGQGLGIAVIPILIMTALFALAATTALSVSLRRGRFALLRAVGATRGQVRRAVLAEQALIALAGGVIGFLPGIALGRWGVRVLVAHGILPPGSVAWSTTWLMPIACGMDLVICLLSGLIAAGRAARVKPAQAVRAVSTERRWLHPVRLLLGLAGIAGVIVLDVVSLHQSGPGALGALAGPLLMAGMVAAALLGPVLVAAAAVLAGPLRRTGPSARLALSGIYALPRRTASAVIPVVMAVGMIGAIDFSNTTISHDAASQSSQTVTAGEVLSGNGLNDALLTEAAGLPGVRAAAGVESLQIAATDPDIEFISGAAVSGGPLNGVLDLDVTSGSLAALQPGQIAVSTLEASNGVMGVHLGSKVTVHLPDGTPYTATVSAIYSRGLAIGDLLIPASVAAGHTGSPAAYDQVLVSGADPTRLSALVAAHPGVQAADRQVYNAQIQQNAAQNGFGNNLILGVIAALAAVTMINTLAVATLERRRQARLLTRVGATRGQLAGMFAWHGLFVVVLGLVIGAAVCSGTLTAVDRAITGSPTPYIPFGSAAFVVATVAALAFGTVMAAFRILSRQVAKH